MKQLTILQVISSSATSGAERHVLDLSARLIERGHSVEIVCPVEGWVPDQASELGIPTHIIPMKGKDWGGSVISLVYLARRIQADIVHTHLTRAAYIGCAMDRLGTNPIVTSVHIANNDRIYNRIARKRNRLVAVSDFVHGMLHGRGINEKFIDTVYNGTDFLDFPLHDPESTRSEFRIPKGRPLIGQIGKISSNKGQRSAVETLHFLRQKELDAHLLLVGGYDFSYEQDLREQIDGLGLKENVTFAGIRDDIPRLLDGCDLVAIPSQMETFGIAAIEAMARSRAVVAARVGALPEVVRDGITGMLYDPGSTQIFDHVEYLLNHPRIRSEMGECGKSIVEEFFSNSRMVDRMEAVYAKAVSNTSAVKSRMY